MTTTTSARTGPSGLDRANPWASGLALFAGLMMIVLGINQVFLGISGIANDDVYVSTPNYVYQFDLTTWGWLHLVFGVVVAVAGFFVIQGQAWARGLGIFLASLNAIVNFLFIPYFPVWAILLIALDVAVIWGLATFQRDRL